jgi:uncharacterized protein DUF559
VLACGTDAVLSHQSAAALWDLRPTSRNAIDVTAGVLHRHPGIDSHRSRCLEPRHRTEHRGIPCTTPARTLVDLAAVLDRAGIERAWHRAEMLDLLDVRAVEHALDNGRGRRGAARVRALLAEQTPDHVTRSELEDRLLALCRDAGIPPPATNIPVEANGATYEVDFFWPDQRLVIETDGWTPHRTREAFETDRRRDADLLVAGLRVARVTWRQLTRDPDRVESMLVSLLQAREGR